MDIKTTFSNGDKAWVFTYAGTPIVGEATIGQVRITITESKGREGEEMFDNFKPQSDREEQYMCEETGIGSGCIYTLGENIFATEEEAREGWAKHIAANE